MCDGMARTVQAGGRLALTPGESVTLMPGVYHAFWGEGDDVLIGERGIDGQRRQHGQLLPRTARTLPDNRRRPS